MREIIAIARNTFKETIRNRILYVILMFALILILFSGAISELTITSPETIIKNLGFAAINLFGVAIAVFVGVSLVYNELEKKTIYTIVSKPIGRWQFLLGKYFGLLLTVWVNILVMTLVFLVTIHYNAAIGTHQGGFLSHLGVSIAKAAHTFVWWSAYDATRYVMPVIGVTCLEMAIITAFAILFSSFTTPTLSMFFTVLTFIAGRLNEDIIKYADFIMQNIQKVEMRTGIVQDLPIQYYLATGAAYLVPNLGAFTRAVEKTIYETTIDVPWLTIVTYGIVYTACVLTLSILIFNRRNFK